MKRLEIFRLQSYLLLFPKIYSIREIHRVTPSPISKQTFKAKINEKFEPLKTDENNPKKNKVIPIKTPRAIKLIIGCSEALKLAMKTPMIISTNTVSITFPLHDKHIQSLDHYDPCEPIYSGYPTSVLIFCLHGCFQSHYLAHHIYSFYLYIAILN